MAEANVDRARDHQAGYWYGAGWDWDPYYDAYTFIPGAGIFYSPFGWGFYSPFDAGFAPIFFFGHFDHDFDRDYRHFGDGDHDRDHFADSGYGDRGRLAGGDHQTHYYNHVDHGVYNGPGHSAHSGFAGGNLTAAGFHGGRGARGGSTGSRGMGSVHGGSGFHGGGAGHAGGGTHSGGGGGGHR